VSEWCIRSLTHSLTSLTHLTHSLTVGVEDSSSVQIRSFEALLALACFCYHCVYVSKSVNAVLSFPQNRQNRFRMLLCLSRSTPRRVHLQQATNFSTSQFAIISEERRRHRLQVLVSLLQVPTQKSTTRRQRNVRTIRFTWLVMYLSTSAHQ